MRTFVVRTVSSVAALCVCASACAAVEPISGGTGGYCVIARDGSPDVSQPDDYTFDGPTGLIRLKTVGSWDLVYQSTDTPGDPICVNLSHCTWAPGAVCWQACEREQRMNGA
jgi:hypothetical protein